MTRFLFLLLNLILLSACASAHAADRILIATATPGGNFSAFGEALVKALRAVDLALEVELFATQCSAENVPLLAAGKVDLPMVEGTVAHETLNGIGRDSLSLPIVSAMFPSPGMFVVQADSPYRDVQSLHGQRIVFGVAGSGFVVMACYMLDCLGLNMQRHFDAVLLERAKDGPPLVSSGEAAAWWDGLTRLIHGIARRSHDGRYLELADGKTRTCPNPWDIVLPKRCIAPNWN